MKPLDACHCSVRMSLSSLPPEDRQSIFCTPEEESAWALSRGDRKNETAGLIAADMAPGNASSATISVSGGGEPVEEAPRSCPREYRGEDVGDEASYREPAGTAAWTPRCIRWDDTVLTTEGHPFLIGILPESVLIRGGDLPSSASPASSGAVFDPARFYSQGVRRDGVGGPPRDAEFDVQVSRAGGFRRGGGHMSREPMNEGVSTAGRFAFLGQSKTSHPNVGLFLFDFFFIFMFHGSISFLSYFTFPFHDPRHVAVEQCFGLSRIVA